MSNGSCYVKAIVKEESAHINKLVLGQKAPKRLPNSNHRDSATKPVPLLRNPINPSSFKNGVQYRPAAPWNAPLHYQPPAMRSYVVVPPNSTVRQPMLHRSHSQQSSSQQTPTRQLYQPPPLQRHSQTHIQNQKASQGPQRPVLTGLQTNPYARTGKPNEFSSPIRYILSIDIALIDNYNNI